MPARRATNLSIDAQLLEAARALDIKLSRAAEDGISRAIARQNARQWREENAEAIKDRNRYIEESGLPLAKYRRF